MQTSEFSIDNKARVARQFSRAAPRYDQAAQVQVDIAFDAMQLLGERYSRLLDIGCGTGRISRQLAPRCEKLLAMDLAEGMLSFAARQVDENSDNINWLQADAENLPLLDHSLDGVFSSMALQWCPNIQQVCQEIYRVLKPNGQAVLAILGDGSMRELQQCWLSLDSQRHVNQFHKLVNWQLTAKALGFEVQSSEQSYITWHRNVRELLGSIKAIGANVVTQTGNHAVISRANLQALQHNYQQRFAVKGQLPLSYRVFFLHLTKS
jgi:malonyl-CoA O-methyltransferase